MQLIEHKTLKEFSEILPVEKRVESLLEHSLYQRVVEPSLSLQLAEEAFKLSKEHQYERGIGISLVQLGFQHWHVSQIEKGLKEVEEGLAIITKVGAYDFVADTNMIRAMIIWSKGEYERSFNIIYDTLKELDERGVKEGLPWMYWCLGVFYYDLKDYSKSIENYRKALQLYEKWQRPDPGCKCYSLVGLGSVYKAKGEYALAVDFLNQGLEMSALYGRWIEQARAHFELGAIFKLQGDYEKARKELMLSYAMRKEHNTKPGMVSSLLELSDIHSYQGIDEEALLLLEEALGYALETKTKPKIYQCHERLSALWKKKGDYKKAFEHMENYYRIKSEVAGDEANNMLKDLETKFATEKAEKEKEIERLKNVELKKANELIEEKNKEIMDSINYARRIQEAILPPAKLVKEYLTESFILYLPKDIVAGDFYWFDVHGDEVYFAVADCTGHGVPGAMVSVVCANALTRVVGEMKITEPAAILDNVRELVVKNFEKSEEEVKDGMDISFCKLNLKSRELTYAGANNPLYRITKLNGEADDKTIQNETHMLIEYKGDKQPIGKHANEQPFTQQKIQLLEGDSIYISSDGYPDQFGGPEGRKFMYKQFKKLFLSLHEDSMDKQREKLIETIHNWRGVESQVDDVCVIGVKILPS